MEHGFGGLSPGGRGERITLYAGIDLSYADIISDSLSPQYEALEHIMQINYCRAGQAVWKTQNGNDIFLNPGDFSVHRLDAGMDLSFHVPTGRYRGLTISVDLQETAVHPPELLAEAGVFDGLLREKFCANGTICVLSGNEDSEHIFSGFYNRPEKLRLPYQRVKVLELLLYLAQMEAAPQNQLTEYQARQIEIVREIHEQLLQHMDQRFTIEELSKQYLINPTTLKNAFKAVYGTSLAAHIKKHRMEQAARMLRETDRSMAEIAQAVGYDSQSKFASTFKKQFAVLPSAYRKQFAHMIQPGPF